MVVDSLYGVWHPQVTMDIHQQGPLGSRMFVPPYLDPSSPMWTLSSSKGECPRHLDRLAHDRRRPHGCVDARGLRCLDSRTGFQHYHGAVRILTETAALALRPAADHRGLRQSCGQSRSRPEDTLLELRRPVPGGVDARGHRPLPDGWGDGDARRTSRATVPAGSRRRAAPSSTPPTGGRTGLCLRDPAANPGPAAIATLLEIFRHAQVEVRSALGSFTVGGTGSSRGHTSYPPPAVCGVAKAMLERQSYPDLREYPGDRRVGPTTPPRTPCRFSSAYVSSPCRTRSPSRSPRRSPRSLWPAPLRGSRRRTGRVRREGSSRRPVPLLHGADRRGVDTLGLRYVERAL